jgi:hypothetical protein
MSTGAFRVAVRWDGRYEELDFRIAFRVPVPRLPPQADRSWALLDRLERRLELTWIRRAPEPPREAEAEAAGPKIPPPPEALTRLVALVEVGRIQDLERALDALEAEDPRLGPWIAEARALAEVFRVHDRQALLADASRIERRSEEGESRRGLRGTP